MGIYIYTYIYRRHDAHSNVILFEEACISPSPVFAVGMCKWRGGIHGRYICMDMCILNTYVCIYIYVYVHMFIYMRTYICI